MTNNNFINGCFRKAIHQKTFLSRLYTSYTCCNSSIYFYCSYKVEKYAEGKTFTDVSKIPYNKVGLLLVPAKQ